MICYQVIEARPRLRSEREEQGSGGDDASHANISRLFDRIPNLPSISPSPSDHFDQPQGRPKTTSPKHRGLVKR
jgi:hypothetical protein